MIKASWRSLWNPQDHQTPISFSLALYQCFLNISPEPLQNYLRYFADRQTNGCHVTSKVYVNNNNIE